MSRLNVEFQAATFYFSGIENQIQSVEARRVFANILPVETAHLVTYKTLWDIHWSSMDQFLKNSPPVWILLEKKRVTEFKVRVYQLPDIF